MNFLTRLVDLIFNKNRTPSPIATERVEKRPTEQQPCSESLPEAGTLRASGGQTVAGSASKTPAQQVDPTPPEPGSASVERVMPVDNRQADAGSTGSEPQRQQSQVPDPLPTTAASTTVEPPNNVAKAPVPARKSKQSDTPESASKASARSGGSPRTSEVPQDNVTAQADKHDIDAMKQSCEMELKKRRSRNDVPAPYFFERAAILSRKIKDYQQEIDYCERYLKMTDAFYKKHGAEEVPDVREGAKHRAIVERLPKAHALLQKQQTKKV